MDRSRNLLEIARKAGGTDAVREVVWGDVLHNPWRRGLFVRLKCHSQHLEIVFSREFTGLCYIHRHNPSPGNIGAKETSYRG